MCRNLGVYSCWSWYYGPRLSLRAGARDFPRLLLTGILTIFIGNKRRVKQKNFLAVKLSAYYFTFPAAKKHSDSPVAYRFCPIFRPNWGPKTFFLSPSPSLISRSGSGTYHNILISLCIKQRGTAWPKSTDWSLWDQQWPRWKWESFIFHLLLVHLLQSVTLLITVYSNTDLKHRHPDWKLR